MIPNERSLTDLKLIDNEPENIKKLGLNGAYRYIALRFIYNITNSGVPIFHQDDVMNYIKSIGIRKDGKKLKFSQPLRFAFKKQTSDVGTPAFVKNPITTDGATYEAEVNYVIHFAENILNENDISALLQTSHLSDLELVITTGDKNDIAHTNPPTINSVKVQIEMRDFVGKTDNGKDINNPQETKMLDIVEIVQEISLEKNRTSFTKISQEIDMVSGSNILEHAILVLDKNIASDDLVSDIRTWNSKSRSSNLERTFKSLNRKTKTQFGLQDTLKGFVKIDWQELLGRSGYITGVKSDQQLQLLTAGITENEDKILLYTKSV